MREDAAASPPGTYRLAPYSYRGDELYADTRRRSTAKADFRLRMKAGGKQTDGRVYSDGSGGVLRRSERRYSTSDEGSKPSVSTRASDEGSKRSVSSRAENAAAFNTAHLDALYCLHIDVGVDGRSPPAPRCTFARKNLVASLWNNLETENAAKFKSNSALELYPLISTSLRRAPPGSWGRFAQVCAKTRSILIALSCADPS